MVSAVMLALLLQASSVDAATPFDTAAAAFTGCLKATVQMGMMSKMDPAQFQVGFAKSCKPQEAAFRGEAIKVAIAQGRTETAAAAEVDGNIANGRRIFAADQASYIATGKVPR